MPLIGAKQAMKSIRTRKPPHLRAVVGMVSSAALFFALAGCGVRQTAEDGASEPSSGWQVNNQIDPITDLVTKEAKGVLEGVKVDAELTISCNDEVIAYSFVVLDKSGQPQPVRNSNVLVRIDKEPAFFWGAVGQAANHVRYATMNMKVPQASLLAIRLSYPAGEETFKIDQTDEALRPMLDQCVKDMAVIEKANRAKSDAEAARRAACGNVVCPLPEDTEFAPLDIPGLVTEAPPPDFEPEIKAEPR